MRGVVLAGGKGTRMGELTKVTNKHLLPVGDWPMIYHPIRKLVGAGVRDILIVTGTEHMGDFVELLGSGKAHGCSLTYRVQDEAGGIAQALGLAEDFAHGERIAVILGDNIFEDHLGPMFDHPDAHPGHAWIFLKKVPDPQRYGVADFIFDCLSGILEKPSEPPTDLAVTGIYVYPPDVFDVIKTLKPSQRGELEITDVNNHYINAHPCRMGWSEFNGYWTDAGTLESWALANQLVRDKPPAGYGV